MGKGGDLPSVLRGALVSQGQKGDGGIALQYVGEVSWYVGGLLTRGAGDATNEEDVGDM
jgi:hypothetical protein